MIGGDPAQCSALIGPQRHHGAGGLAGGQLLARPGPSHGDEEVPGVQTAGRLGAGGWGCGKWNNNTVALQVTWVGVYCRGVAAGPCWQWSEGGGWLTGSVDREGAFTGDNIAFLYPDLRCRTSPLNSIHLASVHLRPLYTCGLYTCGLCTRGLCTRNCAIDRTALVGEFRDGLAVSVKPASLARWDAA